MHCLSNEWVNQASHDSNIGMSHYMTGYQEEKLKILYQIMTSSQSKCFFTLITDMISIISKSAPVIGWFLLELISKNSLIVLEPLFDIRDQIFTPPRSCGGVIFLLQFVCLCVCVCVCVCVSVRLLIKCWSNSYTDFDAVFAK